MGDSPLELLFVARAFPPSLGGVETYNVRVAEHLARRHRLTVLATKADRDPDGDAARAYPVLRHSTDAPWGAAAQLVRAQLERRRPDAVIVSRAARRLAPVQRVLRRAGVPTVVVAHGVRGSDATKTGVRRWWTHRQLGFDHAGLVVANSRHTLELLHRFGVPEARTGIAYPGIEPDVFVHDPVARAAVRARFGLEGRRVLLTVAGLWAHKRIDRIVALMPAVLRRVPDAHYLIVGDGEARSALEQQVHALGIAERVTFAGATAQVAPFYSAADLYVMLSQPKDEGALAGEGFGIVYAEAGGAGLPCVASREGGVPEVVRDGETGFLVTPGDDDTAVDRIVALLADAELAARMGQSARTWVTSQFTWAGAAASLEVGIRRLLAVAR